MFNRLSEWTNKAGNISHKMKDFAKDLITVDPNEDPDDPFMREFLKGVELKEGVHHPPLEAINQAETSVQQRCAISDGTY